jgi:hypothetical protein
MEACCLQSDSDDDIWGKTGGFRRTTKGSFVDPSYKNDTKLEQTNAVEQQDLESKPNVDNTNGQEMSVGYESCTGTKDELGIHANPSNSEVSPYSPKSEQPSFALLRMAENMWDKKRSTLYNQSQLQFGR